jgi:hypothetical protein
LCRLLCCNVSIKSQWNNDVKYYLHAGNNLLPSIMPRFKKAVTLAAIDARHKKAAGRISDGFLLLMTGKLLSAAFEAAYSDTTNLRGMHPKSNKGDCHRTSEIWKII